MRKCIEGETHAVTCATRSDKLADCVAETGADRQTGSLAATHRGDRQIHCRRRQTIQVNSPTDGLTAFARSSIVFVPRLSSTPARGRHLGRHFPFSVHLHTVAAERANPRRPQTIYFASASSRRCQRDASKQPRRRGMDQGPRRHTGTASWPTDWGGRMK